MALVDKIKKLLDEFGIALNDDTRSSLKKALDDRAAKNKGRKRTSRLEASVKPTISFSSGSIKFTLNMNDYWAVVNDGRSPNNVSEEGQEKIAAWSAVSGFAEKIRISDLEQRKQKQSLSKRKGKLKKLQKMPFDRAKKAAGFLVARSLKNKTIEPTHFFDDVIDDGRVQELQDALTELIKEDIIIEIRSSYT
jgi:hypothetical protein